MTYFLIAITLTFSTILALAILARAQRRSTQSLPVMLMAMLNSWGAGVIIGAAAMAAITGTI